MALLKGEGTHQILYGAADIFSGLRHNRGYLARPDHSGSFPTILLVHGHDGVTASVKAFARRLARYGLAVACPDLYRGRKSDWPADKAVASVLADVSHWIASSDTPWVQPGAVGLLAMDRATPAALSFAANSDMVGGVVLISPVVDEGAEAPPIPLLGFFGKEDAVVGAEDRSRAQAELSSGEWVLYGGVGHGLIDEVASDYLWEVAEDIADRTVAHFTRVLAG